MKLLPAADGEGGGVLRLVVRLWIVLEVAAIIAIFMLIAACRADPADSATAAGPSARAESPAAASAMPPNRLSAAEEEAGWRLLFDGATFAGWRGLGRDGIPGGHWVIDDGTIRKVASGEVPTAADGQPLEGGDIMTVESFENFELVFEWKVSPGANSGIKYNVSEAMSTAAEPRYAALGFEYQILDDELHPDAQNGPNRMAAAMYDLIGPASAQLRPVGEFNEARLVFAGGRGEHWLNGVKVVEFDLASDDFAARLAASKYAPIEGFADPRTGHIVLQDHGDDVWFRNIKIRELHGEESH